MKQGDWMCSSCNNHNFASRAVCNKCQAQRPGYQPGDWTCGTCRSHNGSMVGACAQCQAPKPMTMY